LPAALELAVSGGFILLKDMVSETIGHLSNFTYKTLLHSLWIASLANTIHYARIAGNEHARGEKEIYALTMSFICSGAIYALLMHSL
jgi:hypothetical protein